MVIQDMNINTDLDSSKTINPDMVLGSHMDPDITMASGDIAGHSWVNMAPVAV